MDLLDLVTKTLTLASSYPFEKHMHNKHEDSDKEFDALRSRVIAQVGEVQTCPCSTSSVMDTTIEQAPQLKPKSLDDIVRMEQEGDYCFSCIPAKHLQRSHDAMKDAMNILKSKGEFTDVAEEKMQNAVYELNGAEKDLEMARVPEEMKPEVEEFHNQVRKLRNFLRQDQSGLEICTMFNDKKDELKTALETAQQVNGILIKYGYELAKTQMKLRAQQKLGV